MKDIFKRIANLVVEVPEDKPPTGLPTGSASTSQGSESKVLRTIAQLVKEAPGPNLDEVHVPLPAAPPPEPVPMVSDPAPAAVPPAPTGPCISDSGAVDVQAIYAKAGLPATPFTAEQAYQMIHGLPENLPAEMKKQTVTVMLMAMGKSLGVSPETIVTDAARKVAALHSFVEGMSKQSEFFVSKVQSEISEMEQKIAQSRLAIETAQKRINDLQIACEVEATCLNEAAEFFSAGSADAGGESLSLT